MLRNTLKALWAHKRRLLSTTVAVVLGVAFMAGTLVLSDTLNGAFDEFFGETLTETDAVVRGPELINTGFGVLRYPIDERVLDTVAAVEGVAAAAVYVEAQGARVLDADGEPVGGSSGPPTILQNWIDDEALAGISMVDGRGPEADDEMALNLRAARDAGTKVGDEMQVLTVDGVTTFTLVGTFLYGDRESALGAVSVNLTTPVVQRLAGTEGQVASVIARGAEGTSQAELTSRIQAALPTDTELEVLTGETFTAELSANVTSGLGFFTTLLLVFAFIALLVGAFIIFNTFSILVAQRGKELALLRAIGASRRQILVSVLVEAILIGLIAAAIGLGAGILLAIGITRLLASIGLDLPSTGVLVSQGAIVTALVAGVVVTLGSALVPAWRATRVAPLAALRDVAHDQSGTSKVRLIIGLLLLALAGVFALPAFSDEPDTAAIRSVGLASLCLLIGLVVLGPVLARPLARGIGSLLPLVKGTTGQLARENAARSPKRTAATAAALMIGVGLVVFINVFVASAKASIDAEIRRGLQADFIAQSGGFDLGMPLAFAEQVRAVEGVAAASSIQGGFAQEEAADGETSNTFVTAVNPSDHVLAIETTMAEGDLASLVPGTIVYDRRDAENNGIAIGDEITLRFVTGSEATFTVVALGDEPQLLGTRVISQQDWAANNPNTTDQTVFIVVDDGVDLAAMQDTLDEIAAAVAPTITIEDEEAFLGSIASTLNAILNVVYGLLFLSILIALIGIANTLSLSIHERTRELGLLRAVGMTRSQIRSAVRWEAAIIAMIGTLLGLVFGLLTSYSLSQALRAEGFTEFEIPVGSLVVVAVVFAAMGVIASILPARRAAKLNVLDAIATE